MDGEEETKTERQTKGLCEDVSGWWHQNVKGMLIKLFYIFPQAKETQGFRTMNYIELHFHFLFKRVELKVSFCYSFFMDF